MQGRASGENIETAWSSPHHSRQNHKALVQSFLVEVSWVGEGVERSHVMYVYAGRGRIKIRGGSGLVPTKGVTAPSVVSPDLCPLLHIPHWLIAGSPPLRLWLRLAEILQCGISGPFFKDQPNDFHNKTMARVRGNT